MTGIGNAEAKPDPLHPHRRWGTVLESAQCLSNLCPPQGLLSTLRLVLDARCTSPSTILSAARMLCSLLGLVSVGGEPGDPMALAVSIATCVRLASSSLQRMLLQDGVQGGDQADLLDALEEDERKRVAEEACESLCVLASRVTW